MIHKDEKSEYAADQFTQGGTHIAPGGVVIGKLSGIFPHFFFKKIFVEPAGDLPGDSRLQRPFRQKERIKGVS